VPLAIDVAGSIRSGRVIEVLSKLVSVHGAPKPNGGGVNVFYIHTDHLNTPRRISRPSDNTIVWR
jgi:hypothetical protein